MKAGLMSSQWQRRSFRLQSHLQEDPLATVQRQDSILKIPEPGVRLTTPQTPETEKDHIRKARGATTL